MDLDRVAGQSVRSGDARLALPRAHVPPRREGGSAGHGEGRRDRGRRAEVRRAHPVQGVAGGNARRAQPVGRQGDVDGARDRERARWQHSGGRRDQRGRLGGEGERPRDERAAEAFECCGDRSWAARPCGSADGCGRPGRYRESSFIAERPSCSTCAIVQRRGGLSGRQRRNEVPWRKRPPEK
jgi:hypothetical protein